MTKKKIITMKQLKKMNLTDIIELAKKRVRVTENVYLMLAYEDEQYYTTRKEIVEKYGNNQNVKYFANGQVIVQSVEVCSLLNPHPSPIPHKE